MGDLSILNCFRGDMKFSFDSSNPQEVERASRVVQDMLKRGYALFIDEGDGKLIKVKAFDPAKCEYVIADGALYQEQPLPSPAHTESENAAYGAPNPTTQPTAKKRGRPPGPQKAGTVQTRRVAARSVRTTAIAPTAGG